VPTPPDIAGWERDAARATLAFGEVPQTVTPMRLMRSRNTASALVGASPLRLYQVASSLVCHVWVSASLFHSSRRGGLSCTQWEGVRCDSGRIGPTWKLSRQSWRSRLTPVGGEDRPIPHEGWCGRVRR